MSVEESLCSRTLSGCLNLGLNTDHCLQRFHSCVSWTHCLGRPCILFRANILSVYYLLCGDDTFTAIRCNGNENIAEQRKSGSSSTILAFSHHITIITKKTSNLMRYYIYCNMFRNAFNVLLFTVTNINYLVFRQDEVKYRVVKNIVLTGYTCLWLGFKEWNDNYDIQ
jgi:hypothetical protein